MYIKNVKLKNYRGYEEIEVEFKPGINLVIGNNGAGKSSLLAGMRSVLGELFATTKGLIKLNLFESNDVRISSKKVGDTTYSFQKNYPMYVECDLDYKDDLLQLKRGIDGDAALEGGSIVGRTFYQDMFNSDNAVIPLINYQKLDHEWSRASGSRTRLNVEIGPTDRIEGLRDTLEDNNYDEVIAKWCLRMSMIEMERGGKVQEFTTFKSIIAKFLRILMEKESDIEVSYSIEQGGLIYKSEGDNQPIVNLSTGYRAVLSLIMELAYRTVVTNPTITEGLKELEGIFFVDEIDAHLHPRWQWNILEALRQTFPSVQIIVATHSPMIISSAKNAHIIKLQDLSDVVYLPEAYGMSPDDILELRQSSCNAPSEVKAVREELDKAFMDEDVEKADEVLAEAKRKYGADSSVYASLKDSYEVNMWMVSDE